MAKIVLREYLDQINQFVGEGRYSEAAQHCRHILQSYPRHIDTYRALAKSLLEQRQYHDARDVFQRVLSADPSDFIAHAGLAFMNRDEGNLEQAVWHMERAYEVEPHNTAIQEELLDLYRTHYGKRPPKLPLTGAALAWLYFRSELYQLAAAELRKILVDQPERVDLKALLAEVLWRDGQRMDAVNACLQVLDKLPNCIQVNAILAEIWLLTGRIDEAQVYLQRLRDLTLVNQADSDPETAVYRAFAALSTPGLPNTITIEYFNELDESLPGRNGAGAATWLDEADTIAEGEGGEYSWLQDMGAQTDEEVEADQEIAAAEWTAVTGSGLINSDWFAEETPAAPIQPLAQDDMDWLHDLEPDLSDIASPDILADETLAPAAWSPADLPEEPGAVPDWLAGTSDADFEPVHLSAADTAGWLADLTSMAADEPDSDVNIGRTDWFTDHGDADDADDVTAFETPLETPLTDWFKESTGELAASGAAALIDADFAESEAEPEREEENATWSPDDVPAWLMTAPLSTPEAAPAAPRTTMADDAEWGDDLTDWLAETPDSGADTSSTDDQKLPFGIDLDQLLESPGLTTGLLSDKVEADELPDWLLSGQSGLEDVLAPEEPDDDLGLDELFGDLGMFLDGKDDESPSAWADDEAYESLEAQLTGDTTSDADDFGAAAWFDDELAADTAVPLDDVHTPDAFMATVDVDAPFEPIVAPTEKGSSLLDRLLHKMPDEMGAMEAAVSGDMDEKENNLDIPDEVTGQEADDQEISLDWLADLDEQAEAADLLVTHAAAMTPEAATALPDWLDDLSLDDAPTTTTAANKDLTDLLQTHAFVEQPSTAVTDLLAWLDAESSGDEADTTAPVTDEALLAALDADDVALDDVSLGWLDELSLEGDEADLPLALVEIDEAEDEALLAEQSAPLLDLLAEDADDSLTWLAELEVDDGDLTAVSDQPTADETQTWLDDLVEFVGEEEDLGAPDLAAEVALLTDADRLAIDDFFADVETAAEADEAAMSWLDDLTGAAQEESVTTAEADEAVMNWLDDLTPQAEEEPVAIADADEAVMNWLDDLTPQAEEEQVVAALDAAVDWETDDLFTDAALSDAWLEEPDALEADEFERVSLLPELSSPTDDASGDSLSDWLDDFNQDTEEDVLGLDVEEFTLADLLMAADAAGDETISAVDAADAEPAADAFSWLDDLSEEDAEVEVDGTAVAEPQLETDWFTEFVEDEIEDVTADEALSLDALLPDEAQDLAEMPEMFAAETVAAPELPDWFDDLDTEEPDLEAPTLAAPEAELESAWSPDIPDMEPETALPLAVDVFDDLPAVDDDDVMGWLDSLTAAAEAEMEAATLASLDVPAASDVDLAAAMDEAAEDTPSAALSWLETMAVETDVEPEEPVAELADAAASEFDSGIIFPEDAMFPRDVGKPTDVPDELDDTMAWIEQLAAEQGVSLDMAVEEPEFLIPETAETFAAVAPTALPEAEEEAVEEIEDPIAWLEQLASQQSTPIEPLPTVADRAMSETVVPPELPMPEITPVIAAATTELPAATTPPTGADSLDDWLAALIAEQGVSDEFDAAPTPEPEPPAAAPPAIEPEPIPELEVVDEIAADLDWLEMLAAASAAPLVVPLDSAESVAEPAASDLFAALDWVEQQLKQAQRPAPMLETTFVEDIDVSQIPEDPDKTMAWLEQLSDQDEGEVIAAVTAVSPQPPLLTDEEFDGLVSDVPEDPDKNMAWLETLAARQGAPLAERPTQADDATPHEPEPEQPEPSQPPTDALPPSLTTTAAAAFSVPEAADLVFPEDAMFPRDVGAPTDVPEELDSSMGDWLADLMAEQGLDMDDLTPVAATAVVADIEPEEPPVVAAAEIAPEPPAALEPVTDPDVEAVIPSRAATAADAFGMLETDELVFPEDAMFPRDVGTPTDVPEELDSSMGDWLADLMAEQGLDMDDLGELTAVAATAVAADIEPEEPPVAAAAEIAPEPPAALEPVTAPEVEAVIPSRAATAADAFGMLETDELVFPEDAMFPRDVGAPTDVPEELDSSMGDWLADLMAEQGLDMDDLTAVAATAVAAVEAEPTETISPVEWVTEPEPSLAMAETPETDTTVIAEVAEPALELFAEVDSSLDWLDDFSELVELDFDEETPPIPAATAETTPRAAIDPFAAVATRLDAEIGRITGEAASELEDTLFADSEINMDAELAESWPEWLSNDDDEQPGLGETGWLRTLAEPDVAGWLAAEEEGPDEQLFSSADVDFGKMGAIAPAAFDVGPLPEPESGSVADLSDPRITVPILTVNPDELDMARKAMTAGNYTRAVHAYQTLVESGQGLSILIADLETAAHRTPRQPTVRRLLGDAYMRNGQLQKALDTYRQALDLL